MQQPLVSIIIPNYNHELYLKQRLESVFNQTYTNFEVILLDDRSIDNSIEILKQYASHPKVSQFIVNKQNSGSPFKQWQKGIALAKGEYVWIAESDDYCELIFLEKLIRCFQQHKSVGLAYSQTIDVNEHGETLGYRISYTQEFQPNIWGQKFVIEGGKFVQDYLSVKNVIPNASGVIFKKKLVNERIFSPQLKTMKMCGDWLFWSSLALQTSVGFLNENLNYFRSHNSISRNHTTLAIKCRRLIEEKQIRNYLYSNKINNNKVDNNYYKKWFGLFGLKSILKSDFYKGKMTYTPFFVFLNKFLRFKLK